MFKDTSKLRHRLPHAIAACALGASIAFIGMPAVQMMQPADASAQAYAATDSSSIDYSDDFAAHINDTSAPISLTSSGHTYYFVNMQDAVKYSVENVGYPVVTLQSDYTGPAPVFNLPDSVVDEFRLDLNGHTWNVTGENGLVASNLSGLSWFDVYGGTLKTSTADTLVTVENYFCSFGGTIENEKDGGTAIKCINANAGLDTNSTVLAPSGTALELLGSDMTASNETKKIQGDFAYGAYDGNSASFNATEFDGMAPSKFLINMKPLEGADKCTVTFDGGIFKEPIADAYLNNDMYYFTWSQNSDGTYTLNRTSWEDQCDSDDSGVTHLVYRAADHIPAEALSLYEAWEAKYGTDIYASGYKPFPGAAEAKKAFSKSEFKKYSKLAAENKAAQLIDHFKSDFTPYGPTAKAHKGGKATVKVETDPYRHIYNADLLSAGVKAKSYQVCYQDKGKKKIVTFKDNGSKEQKVTVGGLSKGKEYRFRARAVAKINGKTYYSYWSYYSKPIKAIGGISSEATAFKKAKPGKPSAKAYKGHKVKVTFKAAKMPKGVKAKSYQVYYKNKGKAKYATVKATSAKTLKVTVKKLAKGKKYTFKARAVTKIGGKTYYSKWSSYSKAVRAK